MTIGRLITPTIRLLRKLDKGGMGEVWEAENLTLCSRVAVKMLDRSYLTDDRSRTRFKYEAQRAARVNNPHVATVFDHGVTANDEPFIVMELLEGESLKNYMKRTGALPLEDVETLVLHTAKALTTAHGLDVVHRDIKPANLFLVDNVGEPFLKVVDFGIAKQMNLPPGFPDTTTGLMVGTPPYMSPEQYTDPSIVDFRTDLWSLGVVVYEALTGTLPFHGETLYHLGNAITREAFILPCTLRPALPQGIDTWMQKALAKPKAERFGSAREMARSLLMILFPNRPYPGSSTIPPKYPGADETPPIPRVLPPRFHEKPFKTTEPALPPNDKTVVDRRPSSLPPPRKARREDIQAPPFPTERAPLVVARTFDASMLARLEAGFIPQAASDKWFVFMEGNRIYFHRSQTKDPVYEVILEPLSHGRKRIAQAWMAANKKPTHNDTSLARLFNELFFDDPGGAPISARGETLTPAQRIWIHEGDLMTLTVDAIVNSADPSLLGGTGLDGEIHRAAGSGMLAECRALGKCNVGEAKMTKGHSLPAKHVIHTVGPKWRDGVANERNKLAACYANSLARAANAGLRTVAFPSISTGAKGFPLHEAATIAAKTTLDFFAQKTSVELVIFCTFSSEYTEAARAGLARALHR